MITEDSKLDVIATINYTTLSNEKFVVHEMLGVYTKTG
jgi:hypothetical protein